MTLCCCSDFTSADNSVPSAHLREHACCSARDAGVDAQRLEAMAPDAKRPKTGPEDSGGKKKT